MQQQSILYGIVGLLLGSLLTVFITQVAVNTENEGMMRMMGLSKMNTEGKMGAGNPESNQVGMGMSMRGMTDSMEGKTGVSFDKAFLEAMIVHHEGAIEMATEAKEHGQHPQVREMAEDIITAQTSEVEMMKKWISEWGL